MLCSVHFTKDDSTVSWELPQLLLRGRYLHAWERPFICRLLTMPTLAGEQSVIVNESGHTRVQMLLVKDS